MALIPNDDPEHKTQVNHIDGNKLNNCVENLEWVTPLENARHSFDIGLKTVTSFDKIHAACKLLEDPDANLHDISKKTGVSIKTIQRIRNRTAWKDIASQYNVYYDRKPQIQPTSKSSIKIQEMLERGCDTDEICNTILAEYPELNRKKIWGRLDYLRHRAERIPKMKKAQDGLFG